MTSHSAPATCGRQVADPARGSFTLEVHKVEAAIETSASGV
jgi:hypothetical protein